MAKSPERSAKPRTRKSSTAKTHARAAGFSRTRKDHALEQAEDYVELVAALIEEHGEARAVDMALRLGVTHVTVTRTLGRLKRLGLIKTEPYRAVFLTTEGKALAEKSFARHRLVLDFLIAAGVSPETAEMDVEGIEHHVSPETLSVLERLTGELKQRRKGSR